LTALRGAVHRASTKIFPDFPNDDPHSAVSFAWRNRPDICSGRFSHRSQSAVLRP